MESLLHNIEPFINTSAVSSSTSIWSPWVDMSDADGCLFMLIGSSLQGSSKLTFRVMGSSISSSTGSGHLYSVTPISSSTGYGVAANFNYKVAMVDVLKPKYRYNRVRVDGATGDSPCDTWLMIKHHLRRRGSTTLWDSTSIGIGCSTVYASPTT